MIPFDDDRMHVESKKITSTSEVRAAMTQDGDGPEPVEKSDNNPSEGDHSSTVRGNGSVAHQLIGQFIDELRKDEGYIDIARRLEAVVFSAKPTEADLRTAIFGEIDL